MAAEFKTNVMRLIEQAKIKYNHYCYTHANTTVGTEIAEILGQNPNQVFKTLVTVGKSGQNYVFVIPVNRELDLKKAAVCAGEKSIEMIKSKDLLKLTGYIHGGCSPIGMKKFFPTALDESAKEFETILFSAGKIGYQVEMSPDDLLRMIDFKFANLTCD